MRESVRGKVRLEHILTAIDNVDSFLEGKNLDDMQTNKMMFFAVVKNIEIIGEAANNLTKEIREKHAEVSWKDVISMRHVLVHDYYNIDAKTAWQTAKDNLPELRRQICAILEQMK